jgi:hypothetical protein
MNWPMSQEFNEAIQSPALVFSDPELKTGETVVGARGLPLPRSGNFADVYQMRGADGRNWAVKCFTRPVVGLAERYARVDEALAKANLPFTVKFAFLGEGIRVGRAWRPVVKMEWVEGLLFNQVVREKMNQPAILSALGLMWGRMCKRLRESGVAHTDIQHGNVMLVPGSRPGAYGLKLIDYDGMFVPALANSPSGESGHPAYQHPTRASGRIYSVDLDRFPNLVTATALKGLEVVGPTLWEKYDTGDNLLFVEDDFKSPGTSKLMRELWQTGHMAVQALVGRLAIACGKPIPQTPWLDQFAPNGEPAPLDNETRREAAEALGFAIPVAATTSPEPVKSAGPDLNFDFTSDSQQALASDASKQPPPAKTTARTKNPQRTTEQEPKSSNRLILLAGGLLVLVVGAGVAAVAFSGGKKPPADNAQVEVPKNLEPKDPGVKGNKSGSAGTKPKEKEPDPVIPKPKDVDPPIAPRQPIASTAGSKFSFKERQLLKFVEQVPNRMQFLQDGLSFIALSSTTKGPCVFVCDALSGESRVILGFPPDAIPRVQLLSNDEVATWSPGDKSLPITNVATKRKTDSLPFPDLPIPTTGKAEAEFQISPDRRYVAAGWHSKQAEGDKDVSYLPTPFRLLDTKTGKYPLSFDWRSGSIHFTADSSRVLIIESYANGRWFKLPSGEPDGEWKFGSRTTGARSLQVEQAPLEHGILPCTGDFEGDVKIPLLLDASTGQLKKVLSRKEAAGIRLSADGLFAVVLEQKAKQSPGALVVYDVATGVEIGRKTTPLNTLSQELALAPHGKTVLLAQSRDTGGGVVSNYDLLHLGDAPIANQQFTFQERKSVTYTGQIVGEVHFREDGRRLIAISVRDGTLFTCDTMSNQASEIRKFQGPPLLPRIQMLPNDEVVAWSPSDYSVLLIENAAAKMKFLVSPAALPEGAIKSGDFNVSPDHRYAAAGIRNSNFRLVDLNTGTVLLKFAWKYGSIHFTADSSRVLIVEQSGTGRWFKLPSGELDGEWKYTPQNNRGDTLRAEQTSLAHGLLLCISDLRGGPGWPVILDAKTGQTKVALGSTQVVRARLSSDGKFAVVLEPWQGEKPGSLVVYDVATGTEVGRTPTPPGTDNSELDLSPQDKSVLIVARENSASRIIPYSLQRPQSEATTPKLEPYERTDILGPAKNPEFQDTTPDGGLLVGFEIGLAPIRKREMIRSIRPIYHAGDKESMGEQHGTPLNNLVTVKAKDGYAVGAISVLYGLKFDGMSVTFMKVVDGKLDPKDSYESKFVGSHEDQPLTRLGGSGSPVIGIIGRKNDKEMTGMGLLLKGK